MFKRPFFIWFSFKRWPSRTGRCLFYYRIYLGKFWTPFIWVFIRDIEKIASEKQLSLLECRISDKAKHFYDCGAKDRYTRGLINGMLFAQSLFLNRTPIYIEEQEDES